MSKKLIVAEGSIAGQLIASCPTAWEAYTGHAFVHGLGDGSLHQPAFQHYLIQDYIFLIHFSRAWALSAFKAETIDDIRQAAAILNGLINEEITMHVAYCQEFGISETEIAAATEARENIAYTRFVIERGLAGDLLDILVALAPCVIGYGEIGQVLDQSRDGNDDQNPYGSWIDMYAGPEYRGLVTMASAQLDRVAAQKLGPDPLASPRWPGLVRDFEKACWLEADFWQMGWKLDPRAGAAAGQPWQGVKR